MTPSKHVILQLLADISDQWEEIGLAIDIPQYVLTSLRMSPKSNIVKLSQVLQYWMDTQFSPVTWEKIISAIEGPIVNNKRKAKEICQYLGN